MARLSKPDVAARYCRIVPMALGPIPKSQTWSWYAIADPCCGESASYGLISEPVVRPGVAIQ